MHSSDGFEFAGLFVAVSLSLLATSAEANVLSADDTPQVLHIDDAGN
jgi:hypothetical protein